MSTYFQSDAMIQLIVIFHTHIRCIRVSFVCLNIILYSTLDYFTLKLHVPAVDFHGWRQRLLHSLCLALPRRFWPGHIWLPRQEGLLSVLPQKGWRWTKTGLVLVHGLCHFLNAVRIPRCGRRWRGMQTVGGCGDDCRSRVRLEPADRLETLLPPVSWRSVLFPCFLQWQHFCRL